MGLVALAIARRRGGVKFRFAADGTNDVGAVGGIGEVPQVLARSTKIWANILPRWRVGVLLSLFQRPLLFGGVY